MKILSMLALCCALFFPDSLLAEPVVLVFGDSLSAGYGIPSGRGWVDALQLKLRRSHRVVNASVSGETTSGGEARIGEVLRRERPNIVILELGANDGLRGAPVGLIESNLDSIIRHCLAARAKVLLIGMRLPPNYGERYGREFSDIYPSLARRHKLPLVPFMMEGFADRLELFQPDAMHPDVAAQPLVLQNVWSKLAPLLR